MSYASLAELRDGLRHGQADPAWAKKMLHPVPELPSVKDRVRYLVEKVTGKVVLDIGCTGPISAALKQAASRYYGVDRTTGDWVVADMDVDPASLPVYEDVECVVVSELLEHLANPGWFLCAVRDKYPGRDVYLTVPNAGAYQVKGTDEVVNGDHVAWYSYTTLTTLLARCGFTVERVRWYNGPPHTAEGLIVVATSDATVL